MWCEVPSFGAAQQGGDGLRSSWALWKRGVARERRRPASFVGWSWRGRRPASSWGHPRAARCRRLAPLAAVSRLVIAREWGRIGVTGFGGPPAHVALLRRLCVQRHRWMSGEEFAEANAACGLLPGPASTQLALYCARRVGGVTGALVGGIAFIAPGLGLIIALAALFLTGHPPTWVRGAGAGAGAAVAAVAVRAGLGIVAPAWAGLGGSRSVRARFVAYAALGAVAAAAFGPYVVVALLACGVVEVAIVARPGQEFRALAAPLLAVGKGGLAALAWTAFKVGALSYGGGFVIVPLMRHDAVDAYHWLSSQGFSTAIALGQVTPGPVVLTVAAVGYAAHGLAGVALATVVAFAPSFAFVIVGGARFDRLRANPTARAFLGGAAPAAAGAILGAAVPLAGALREPWQALVLAAVCIALASRRAGVVTTLVGAGVVGAAVAVAGGAV